MKSLIFTVTIVALVKMFNNHHDYYRSVDTITTDVDSEILNTVKCSLSLHESTEQMCCESNDIDSRAREELKVEYF